MYQLSNIVKLAYLPDERVLAGLKDCLKKEHTDGKLTLEQAEQAARKVNPKTDELEKLMDDGYKECIAQYYKNLCPNGSEAGTGTSTTQDGLLLALANICPTKAETSKVVDFFRDGGSAKFVSFYTFVSGLQNTAENGNLPAHMHLYHEMPEPQEAGLIKKSLMNMQTEAYGGKSARKAGKRGSGVVIGGPISKTAASKNLRNRRASVLQNVTGY